MNLNALISENTVITNEVNDITIQGDKININNPAPMYKDPIVEKRGMGRYRPCTSLFCEAPESH